MAYTEEELKKELEQQEYQYGFTTDIDAETFPVGLNKEIVKKISAKKNEPSWMTEWRLSAFEAWKKMEDVFGYWPQSQDIYRILRPPTNL